MAKVISVGPESGPQIEVFKRAVPEAENHRLPIGEGWEIALPRISVYNPHGRAGETRTLNGIPERDITLYDPAGRVLGRFSKIDFDANGRAFIKADDPANPWRIFPDESSQTLWAVHENTIWAFDSKTGLLKGQQIGDQLIQYDWSFFSGPFSKTILEEITYGPHSVKFEHGNGGLKITGLTASDGRKVSFLPADPAEMVSAKVRHFNTPEAPPTEMNINSGNGNWELIGERNIADNYYFLNRHGRAVGQILATGKRRKRPYTVLFPDGGHTLVISNGEITIVPFRMSDFLRRQEYRHFGDWQVAGVKKMEGGRTKVLLSTEGEQTLVYFDNREKELTHYFFGKDARELYKFDRGMESAENTVLEMKGITNMTEEVGIVDLRIHENSERMAYSTAAGEVEFDPVNQQNKPEILEAYKIFKNLYSDNYEGSKFSFKHFTNQIAPIYKLQKQLVEKTGKQIFLTKGLRNNKLHRIDEVILCADKTPNVGIAELRRGLATPSARKRTSLNG